MKSIIVCLIFFSALASASEGGSWGYGETHNGMYGPADWSHIAPHCGGNSQSPVNIQDVQSSDLPELNVGHDGRIIGQMTNNGHAPTITFDKNHGGATLTGGPLDGDYELQQFHFHFGCTMDEGSEHTLKDKAYPAELHLVFFNKKYPDFSAAVDKSDGLAVIGVFLAKSKTPNEVLERLTRKLRKIKKEGTSVDIEDDDQIDLEDLVPDLDPYYTYPGSLTTPPCYESVRWIVLHNTVGVSRKQLRRFRRLKAQHGYAHGKMCNNFRPIQPINGRDINNVNE